MSTLVEYAQRFTEENSLKGSIAKKIIQTVEQGHSINDVADLIIWLVPAEAPEASSLERCLYAFWAEYCAACDHPL